MSVLVYVLSKFKMFLLFFLVQVNGEIFSRGVSCWKWAEVKGEETQQETIAVHSSMGLIIAWDEIAGNFQIC